MTTKPSPKPQQRGGNRMRCGHSGAALAVYPSGARICCKLCSAAARRRHYYKHTHGIAAPLPIAYQIALREIPKDFYVRRQSRGERSAVRVRSHIARVLNTLPAKERAIYLLTKFWEKQPEAIQSNLGVSPARIVRICSAVDGRIQLIEHRTHHKDWGLVGRLIDEGMTEGEVREFVGISLTAWSEAKRRGDVRL